MVCSDWSPMAKMNCRESHPLVSSTPSTNATMPIVKHESQEACRTPGLPVKRQIAKHTSPKKLASLELDKITKDRKLFQSMLEEVSNKSNNRELIKSRTRHQNKIDRDAFVAALQSACVASCSLESFKSVPTVQSQLQAEFIHRHYAKEGEDFFPSKMILTLTPDTASFSAASNALYLTQLAASAQDQRLLRNAVRSYQGALRLLRKDLSKPRACHDDHVFGTIHVLNLCEAFKGISIDETGRDQHTKGTALLFHARGPKSLQDVYMMVQLQQHHHRVLLEGLLARKRPLVGKGQWLDVDKDCPLRLTSLTTLVLRVPGALEDANSLLAKGRDTEVGEIIEMLSGLKALETDLQSWMTAWYAETNTSPYWKAPVTSCAWLPKSDAFGSALQFPAPLAAKAHVLYWMPLLCLRDTIKQVAELHPFPLLATNTPLQNRTLWESVMECANGLCMTAMYLTNPMNGVDGCMEACGPITIASRWYKSVGDYGKLQWCYQMSEYIESQGIRAPHIETPRRLVRLDPS